MIEGNAFPSQKTQARFKCEGESRINLNHFFIMKTAYEDKFLVNMNTIEEGLNFIVPA